MFLLTCGSVYILGIIVPYNLQYLLSDVWVDRFTTMQSCYSPIDNWLFHVSALNRSGPELVWCLEHSTCIRAQPCRTFLRKSLAATNVTTRWRCWQIARHWRHYRRRRWQTDELTVRTSGHPGTQTCRQHRYSLLAHPLWSLTIISDTYRSDPHAGIIEWRRNVSLTEHIYASNAYHTHTSTYHVDTTLTHYSVHSERLTYITLHTHNTQGCSITATFTHDYRWSCIGIHAGWAHQHCASCCVVNSYARVTPKFECSDMLALVPCILSCVIA